ncbi:hypothetical protein AK812_SmicGene37707 [Symbiodinium microadriaticum]|uniref:Uncharacterized protein n=1 Tax=Symbiodinium microadriaticum TaxID=2951 RepID=A0A1Q9CFL7_SYMMI|nr:hypothetical protein AK812_SmicGene37707 [Symbiodinium microadriaticum]
MAERAVRRTPQVTAAELSPASLLASIEEVRKWHARVRTVSDKGHSRISWTGRMKTFRCALEIPARGMFGEDAPEEC